MPQADDQDAQTDNRRHHSWKDEYLTIILTIPIFLAFCGKWGAASVTDGFSALASAPEWYKVAFMASVTASFGIRAVTNRSRWWKK